MAAVAMAQVVPLLPTASSSSSSSRSRSRSNVGLNLRAQPKGVSLYSRQSLIALGSLPVLGLAASRPGVVCAATKEGKEKDAKEKEAKAVETTAESNEVEAETVTRKFGLEAGLWKIFSAKGDEEGEGAGKGKKANQAKQLLKRYGGAYLATSISLSLVSFALCYALVQSGVDVPSVLEKVGIHVNETGEKVGTVALAYAAHKALSPVRFPPTVALTPIVAAWFGKNPAAPTDKDSNSQ